MISRITEIRNDEAFAEVGNDADHGIVRGALCRARGMGLGRLVGVYGAPGACVAIVIISVTAMFTSGNISSDRREDVTNCLSDYPPS